MEFITQPWPWFVGGPLIAFVLFLTFYFGKAFGVSRSLETFCTIGGAGKLTDYFKVDLKERKWSLFFIAGIVIGGFISSEFLMSSQVIDLNPTTVKELTDLGFANAGKTYLPEEIFSLQNLLTVKGFLILIGAGILIGFGTRYAGGCTSGHAITGLSSLQLPSLVATIGFFIGGLVMTWFLIPLIF
ncbi:YeeE/YedE thiosulfate transporter family protein [Polaribacter sp. Z022]|uniref:YeeE/YedE family protein n=1 Tax=Polaribacter sp. Z022 TaxID=2927125 RepID=UPI0020228A11|nr:YeeE/YedE thiosulfate transporter family protein [Polaribacter sp. Z022]MCL7752860.1 YeeE/YedE family protein [Polaribacter sp. Z022]